MVGQQMPETVPALVTGEVGQHRISFLLDPFTLALVAIA
jgi:hypothetical protein